MKYIIMVMIIIKKSDQLVYQLTVCLQVGLMTPPPVSISAVSSLRWSISTGRELSTEISSRKICCSVRISSPSFFPSLTQPSSYSSDSAGYVKLVDFGFSKRLEPGCKTWTFCGTPGNHTEYFQLNHYLKNIFRVRGAGDHPQQGPRQVRGLLVSRDPDV